MQHFSGFSYSLWRDAPPPAGVTQGEGYVRWCFAADEEKLAEGVARLRRALDSK